MTCPRAQVDLKQGDLVQLGVYANQTARVHSTHKPTSRWSRAVPGLVMACRGRWWAGAEVTALCSSEGGDLKDVDALVTRDYEERKNPSVTVAVFVPSLAPW